MRRRDFIAAIAATTIGTGRASAQQTTVPIIGFLSGSSRSTFGHSAEAFRRGLTENGFGPGLVAIEERWAEGEMGRLRGLADELVRSQVALIAAGGDPAALAAKEATASIPIVCTAGDLVRLRLVASYNKPGGNVTGIAIRTTDLGAKRLSLVRELVPAGSQFAALLDPSAPTFNSELRDMEDAARALGLKLQVLQAGTPEQIDAAFARIAELQGSAMVVGPSFFYSARREQLAKMALSQRLPAMFSQREYALAGGLMSYSTDIVDAYYQAGAYAAKILKGAQPAELPVGQSAKFQLVINQKTAKALGLTFPSGIISIADEVIE